MSLLSRLLVSLATALVALLVMALPAASADPPMITHYVDETAPVSGSTSRSSALPLTAGRPISSSPSATKAR
jgi:hypothetical protein